MKRREFIALVGGTTAYSIVARAQRMERTGKIGVLMTLAASDPEGKARIAAFQEGLQRLGWTNGHGLQMDVRWAAGDVENYRIYAGELVSATPDVLLGSNASSVRALRRATVTIPIVFAGVSDPVGMGLVQSLAHPGGNATGFMLFEFSLAGKWLELLKEIAPRTTTVGIIRDSDVIAAVAEFGALQAVAPSLGIELQVIEEREIERGIPAFAREPNRGLIVLTSSFTQSHRDLLTTLAAAHKLPAVYWQHPFVESGGLASYGPDVADQFRRAAGYVDRILKGERPADLPVQVPTKYELAINLKTAKSMGVEIPAGVRARADKVIE
jgi:putative ABC transport system substrate-binding protein